MWCQEALMPFQMVIPNAIFTSRCNDQCPWHCCFIPGWCTEGDSRAAHTAFSSQTVHSAQCIYGREEVFSKERTNLLYIVIFLSPTRVKDLSQERQESCIKQDDLFAQRKLEMCRCKQSFWKVHGLTCALVFWRYELQNTTAIPNQVRMSGPSRDMALKNYSKVWNASKTTLIWNLIHLKAAWYYYDNIQQASRWLF